MFFWSDFVVAKTIHKEREQAVLESWALKQAQAESKNAPLLPYQLGQWWQKLSRIFQRSQSKQEFVCC